MNNEITLKEVDDLIEIRSDPHIYVFSTNTIPNYVKVGDTFRPIETRLKEWREIYKDINKLFPNINNEIESISKINDEIYFRDYSLHKYLENNHFHRLIKSEFIKKFGKDIYFSNEFFENVSVNEIINGIRDIKQGYENNNKTYQYYKIANKQAIDMHWKNDKDWKLRDNQEKVVNNFCEKLKTTEKEFLMYAVMRFGKSFTALSCAQKNDYRKVLVVSAKADVVSEWKKTVEMPRCFKNYAFLCDKDFVKSSNVVDEVLKKESEDEYLKNKDSVVVFLTLQNLSGKDSHGKNIKEKLQKVYITNFDMIIIDETHYGAWANSYGRPLNNKEEDEEMINLELNDLSIIKEEIDKIKGKIKLHLSGTPYKLLYSQKFSDKNIIATCQFSDILKDKEKWYENHKQDIDSGKINAETNRPYEEFDNPYFGFPKMLRFAFSIPSSTQAKLISAQSNGNKWTLNDFLVTNKNRENIKFIYEEDVLKLLNIIDGKEQDEHILSFLNIPKIKDNQVCKHIVMVLPYKYSCDAMEQLLVKNANNFINLKNYKILNITGHNVTKENESIESVKNTIKESEKQGVRTITLTVNKMLTGVTVPEWDTMIMLKNTKSPQEYDQAIFRIQNQYVKEITSINDNNETDIVKIDMKPQTILVDFDPIRMFELQGLSTKIVNKVKKDQIDLDDALNTELKYFPIITNNADKLVLVNPTNIVEVITNYNKNISILESSSKADLDFNMLSDSDIQNFINSQSSKGIITKLSGEMHKGENSDIDIENINNENDDTDVSTGAGQTNSIDNNESATNKNLKEKYRKCIACLMFYAFLTKSKINSMQDIINSIEKEGEFKLDNNRIFEDLLLNSEFIKKHINLCHRQYAIEIDNLLSQANLLSKDETLSPEKRVENALARFSRISDSEIVTPMNICNEMCGSIASDNLVNIVNNQGKLLDIAGKTGEFAISLYNILKDKVNDNILKNCIFTIPTSSVTYELTRKIYEILGLNIDNISYNLNSYGLLDLKLKNTKEIDYNRIKTILTQDKKFSEITIHDKVKEGGKKVKFEVIVGNPPYQEMDGGHGSSSKPIYNKFIEISQKITPKYISIIMPSRWMTGGKGLDKFRKKMLGNHSIKVLHDYPNARDCFDSVQIEGGICYILIDNLYRDKCNIFLHQTTNNIIKSQAFLDENKYDIIIRDENILSILNMVRSLDQSSFSNLVLSRNPFGINEDAISPYILKNKFKGSISLFGRFNYERGYKFLSKNFSCKKNSNILNFWKVFVAKADGAAGQIGNPIPAKILGKAVLGNPNHICTETFLCIAPLSTKIEAENVIKYMSTKFFRFMTGIRKNKNMTRNTYLYTPLQDFTYNSDIDWSKSISEIDKQLYQKYQLTENEINFIEKSIKPME